MKHIVVYTIIILGLASLTVSAQKPSIDLLPTTSESAHPEAMIDTSITHDSRVLFDSLTLNRDSLRGGTAELNYLVDTSPALHQKTIGMSAGTSAGIRLGLYSLFLKKVNPITFIIYFTALKF